MIIYNTTFHIAADTVVKGIEFLKNEYIPAAVSSGSLSNPRLSKVLIADTEEGESYSLQFHVKNTETLNSWIETEGRMLHHALGMRFGTKVAGFSTLLEEIDLPVYE